MDAEPAAYLCVGAHAALHGRAYLSTRKRVCAKPLNLLNLVFGGKGELQRREEHIRIEVSLAQGIDWSILHSQSVLQAHVLQLPCPRDVPLCQFKIGLSSGHALLCTLDQRLWFEEAGALTTRLWADIQIATACMVLNLHNNQTCTC